MTNPHRRDLISESGYRLFFELLPESAKDANAARAAAVKQAQNFLTSSIGLQGEPVEEIDDAEAAEIDALARWLASYFVGIEPNAWRSQIQRPNFRGHGIITAGAGDFELNNTLFEMKYVDRGFRTVDLRQLLVYCALRYYEQGKSFEKVALVNPLLGIEFVANPREIIYSSSGTGLAEFFQELSYVASSGEISH